MNDLLKWPWSISGSWKRVQNVVISNTSSATVLGDTKNCIQACNSRTWQSTRHVTTRRSHWLYMHYENALTAYGLHGFPSGNACVFSFLECKFLQLPYTQHKTDYFKQKTDKCKHFRLVFPLSAQQTHQGRNCVIYKQTIKATLNSSLTVNKYYCRTN